MFKFFLQILMMLSLGAVIYLIARATPRISDEELKTESGVLRENRLMLFLEKIDVRLKIVLEKLLRRTRVWILKLDNFIVRKLRRFKKELPKESGFSTQENNEKEKEIA